MKYKYSEKYQEAAILNHRGIYNIHAAEKLMKRFEAAKKPCLSIIIKSNADQPGKLIAYDCNGALHYGKAGDMCFNGFGTACLSLSPSNYRSDVKRYKLRTI